MPHQVCQGVEVGERQVGEERANLSAPLLNCLKFDGMYKLLVERQGAHWIRKLPEEKLEQGSFNSDWQCLDILFFKMKLNPP